jgi:ribonucleoside-triphosphate reductase
MTDNATVIPMQRIVFPTIQKDLMKEESVSWGPIGKEVYQRTYSRTKPDGTQETWADTVERVVDGNLGLVPRKHHETEERRKLLELIYKMDMLPAGRHLWSSGVPGRQFLFNCHATHFSRKDLAAHFTFLFDELMKGGGVGSNYSNKHIELCPPIFSKVDFHVVCNPSHPNYGEFNNMISRDYGHHSPDRFVIDDSREGWCASLSEVLLAAWHGKDTPLIIDVSMLREKGALLKSFGGKSSGPAPLVTMLTNVARIMNTKVGHKLSSLDIMAIDHEIATCVVSGNIRRSARMSIKHWADKDIADFIHCKADEKSHWSTNISVEVDDEFFRCLRKGEAKAKKVLHEVVEGVRKNGEPGLWNSSLSSVGEVETPCTTNPCGEIALAPWENCNLGHVNLERFAGRDVEAKEAFRLMARFLVRATFGDVLSEYQKAVQSKNRRIGVGFFGFHSWLVYQGVRFSESHHNREIRERLKMYYNTCREEARKYAFELRMPEPIKVTTIAPTGTISNLPGTTSGCQPIFAKYFKRRVNYASNDSNLKALGEQGFPIEDSVYTKNTKVVTFFCKDPLVDACERRSIPLSVVEEQTEISVSDHLAVQSMLQREYADNGISYTINCPADVSADEIVQALKVHLPHLKGTTLMPEGESRAQTPLERITKEEFEEAEKKGLAKVSDAERACLNGACPIK